MAVRLVYYQLQEKEGWKVDKAELIGLIPLYVDAVFFCNPNNPTGLYYSHDIILPILKECETQGCYLIVDEAFHDFVNEYEPLSSILKRLFQDIDSIAFINEDVCYSGGFGSVMPWQAVRQL